MTAPRPAPVLDPLRATAAEVGWAVVAALASAVVRHASARQAAVRARTLLGGGRPGCPGVAP